MLAMESEAGVDGSYADAVHNTSFNVSVSRAVYIHRMTKVGSEVLDVVREIPKLWLSLSPAA